MASRQNTDSYRTVAHPLRSRILAHLRLHGGATATELAAALDTHTGATSYHTRVLAEAGLVEDTGLGNGKTRIWAIAEADDDGGETDALEFLDDEDESDANWLEHDYLNHTLARAHAWVDAQHAWPSIWQEECRAFDAQILVSEEHLTAFRAELDALLGRYRRMGAGTPGAQRVLVTVTPTPLDL